VRTPITAIRTALSNLESGQLSEEEERDQAAWGDRDHLADQCAHETGRFRQARAHHRDERHGNDAKVLKELDELNKQSTASKPSG